MNILKFHGHSPLEQIKRNVAAHSLKTIQYALYIFTRCIVPYTPSRVSQNDDGDLTVGQPNKTNKK